jgi:3-hydroxyisobutyrate dehydrogenase-like beta-hydroxyacid dehydrogenase
LTGFDLRDERLALLEAAGGKRASSVGDVGENSDTVFVMVLNGQQAIDVVGGEGGLRRSMKPRVNDHHIGDDRTSLGPKNRTATRRQRH